MARLQWQNQIGSQQQQQEQNIINQAINNYAMAQNYPQQQLAGYNALLRGYATPTTTTQSYQAAPNMMSQLGGLAATGIGAYGAMGGFRGAKGGLPKDFEKAKRFNVGGSLEANLEFLSRTPEGLGKLRVIAKTSASKTLRDEASRILANVEEAQGIQGMPTNLPVEGYAPGGIIAFSGKDTSLVTDDTADESFKQLPDKERRAAAIAYAMDNAKNPLAILNPGELWDKAKSYFADTDTQNAWKRALASPNSPVAQNLPPVPVKSSPTTPSNAPAASPVVTPTPPAAPSSDDQGITAGGKYEAQIQKLMDELNKGIKEGKSQSDLDDLRQEIKDRKNDKFWQALMIGGAKTMAGQSRHGLANLGEGITSGVQEYGKAEAAERADKKLLIAQQSALEQLEYAKKSGNLNALIQAQTRLDNVKMQTMALSLQRQGIQDARLQTAITARAKLILGNNPMPTPQEVDSAIDIATSQVTGKGAGPSLSAQAAAILEQRKNKG